ncbi:hypothetical protein V492_06608 [Pseudogymnoascus sp. VKM F-4246]|nr:hypothetical protein V492_06608 [Pseudogymnoascus sp. VKM F-4246]
MDETSSTEQRAATQKLLNESRRNHPGSKAGHEGQRPFNPTMENNSPLLLPSGLNSMLKNTTETGDIGIFSIKPSRLPRHPAITRTAGRARSNAGNYRRAESQLPYHGPRVFSLPSTIDDRTRLPSYSRDATSDVASLYENSSQKSSESSKILEDQDRRSYSMTLSSFPGYRLPNPHSSTSLSSQIDQSDAQRPRSSFQYPARLKRPGFRPSSPALTDGGAVDYSRRVEIQRETSSPNCQNVSLRPLSLRSDVNRSTPTGSGKVPSPQSFKRMPVIQRDDAPVEGLKHVDTPESSARANLSPTTFANSRPANRTAASVPTQNRAHHSSPLYYDYSEGFFNEAQEGDHVAEELEEISPAPFLVEKTIHEDRELSSDWSYLAMTDLKGRGFLANEQLLLPHEDTKSPTNQPTDISYAGARELPSHDDSASVPENAKQHSSLVQSTKSLSLEHNVERMNSNQNIPQSVESGPGTDTSKLRNLSGDVPSYGEPVIQHDEAVDELALRDSSPYSLSPHFQPVASHPSGFIGNCTGSNLPISSQGTAVHVKRKPLSREVSEADNTDNDERSRNKLDPVTPTHASQRLRAAEITPFLQRSISAQNKRDKSSPYFRARPNSTSSTQPDTIPEVSKFSAQTQGSLFRVPDQNYGGSSDANQNSPMLLQHYKHSSRQATFPARKYRSDGSLIFPSEFASIQALGSQGGNSKMYFGQAGPFDQTSSTGGRNGFNLTGVVSPIPIHPGQQFFAPATMDDSELQSKTPILLETPTRSGESPIRLLDEEPSVEPASQHFFSKLRLKARASTVRAKPSPPVTRRRNLDGSYPLDDRRRDIELMTTTGPRRPVSFAPKLKLKVGRASVSSFGTVRINREAAVHPDLGDSELISPDDLFTPPPRLANLFRQVSRHFRPKDEYEEIKAPEATGVGEPVETGFPATLNDTRQASGVESRVHDHDYPEMHPGSDTFVYTPLSPYPSMPREPTRDRMSPEKCQGVQQLPHYAAVMPAAVQAGGIQGFYGEYGSQLEDSSYLQGNVSSLRAEQPSHHPMTGENRQAPASAPWTTGNAWDQFQAPDLAAMDDESDNISTETSRGFKAAINDWLQGMKATMFGCGRSRR